MNDPPPQGNGTQPSWSLITEGVTTINRIKPGFRETKGSQKGVREPLHEETGVRAYEIR